MVQFLKTHKFYVSLAFSLEKKMKIKDKWFAEIFFHFNFDNSLVEVSF